MTQLPFNPRTMTAKNALAALADHPDLTVAQLADLLAEEGRHDTPRISVRKELNARIEAAAPLDDESEGDLADEPDEEDESTEATPEAEAGEGLLDKPTGSLEFGEDMTVTFSDGTVHEARFKRYVAGIEVILRDQRDTVVVSLDGDWVVTPKPPEAEEEGGDE
tara:strand:+ start:71 stop:562 length:492 start_codon:yes stop_codon:yes gene_type:complete